VSDLPAIAVALGRALHAAGVPVTPERSARFARSAGLVAGDDVRWAARAVFVSTREEGEIFDRVFTGPGDAVPHRGDPTAPPMGIETRRTTQSLSRAHAAAGSRPPLVNQLAQAEDGQAADGPATLAAFSADERLRRADFASLSPEELQRIRVLMERLAVAPPERRSRRLERASRGAHVDLRTTLRRSHRTGGDPVRLARRRRRMRRRRLVLLLDVSGSMEPYARAYLQFLESAAAGARAEAFVFATRLTRLTRPLRAGAPQRAIERAAAEAPDWAGGTRLGAALREFNDGYGRRGMARGAVVVVLSDGWERAEPELVGREMERLARLAHRVVWVNPRAAAPGWAPLAAGMAAAAPHCDAVVSGHSVEALDAVLEAIGASTPREGERWSSRTSST
jgi:uncharacterized protein